MSYVANLLASIFAEAVFSDAAALLKNNAMCYDFAVLTPLPPKFNFVSHTW